MKKVLTIVLVFVLVLAVLLGGAALWQRFRPAREIVEEPQEKETVISNVIDPAGATVIRLEDGNVSVTGLGAEVQGKTVTLAYPGTYRVEGTLTDGQIVVDLGDFHGAAYIILNGADIACSDGPAIHVVQADRTELYLAEGTENRLRDGADYLVQEGQEKKTGAGIYSADDLLIAGEGSLTVIGASADGIRSKDALTILGGRVAVYAADDGLQASDFVEVTGGEITVGAYGDGIATTEGYVTVSGGTLNIASAGDGIDAFTELTVSGGAIDVTACGGPGNYAAIALEDLSAKGLEAENIAISGGDIRLSTADDGIHGARDVSITGGSFVIASGDDAVHAAGVLDIRGVQIDVTECYEGLEGGTVRLSEVMFSAAAENNGIDAGEGGVTAYACELDLTAPRAVSSDGVFHMLGGTITLDADGTDSLFSFASAELVGCTVLAGTDSGRSETLLAKGKLPGSVLFGFAEALPAGTEFVISAPSGETVYSFSFDKDVMEVYLALGGLLEGQTYTLTAGENAMEFTYDPDGCVVNEQELPMAERGGWGGFPGMPGPGGRR